MAASTPVNPRPVNPSPASPVVVAPLETIDLSAAERMAASRARLHSALLDIANPAPKPSMLENLADASPQLGDRIMRLPGAALIVDSVDSWWKNHPLRIAATAAEQASRGMLAPLAKKNPAALLGGAAVVGALFFLTRPWRWLLRPALFLGLVPQLVTHALKRIPRSTWVRLAGSMVPNRSGAQLPRAPHGRRDGLEDH